MKQPKELPWDQDLYQRLDALCSIGAKDLAMEKAAQVLQKLGQLYGGTEYGIQMRNKLASVWDRIRREHEIDTKI